jgi:glycine dehydrogenase
MSHALSTKSLASQVSNVVAEAPSQFSDRHIGPSRADVDAMLKVIGVQSVDELIDQTIPKSIRLRRPLDLPEPKSERDALDLLRTMADRNAVTTTLIGMGYYGTILPPVIQRNILESPAWYTAYTPYQPEISQGRLEALINFQTLVCDLTGMDIANASLLDEATAAAEAMALAKRSATTASTRFLVDANTHPQTLAVLRTRAEPLGWQVDSVRFERDLPTADYFGALIQYPGTFGAIPDLRAVITTVHAGGGVAVVAADPLALMLLASPGELGADIAVGSMQRYGVPMGFGGPHAAYMALKSAFQRGIPGRLVGISKDAHGDPAYRLALQTREQHIRRDKATSNICTSQVLLAIVASMYAIYHGPEGLKVIAQAVHRRTAVLAAGLRRLGYKLVSDTFFDTISVVTGGRTEEIQGRAGSERINMRIVRAGDAHADTVMGISTDETTTERTIEAVWRCFGGTFEYQSIASEAPEGIPTAYRRTSRVLEHPVFNRYHSETEMLRYMRRLSDRDIALDRSMIPLGSCTMKLNATAEMLPISWPSFNSIHPFAPAEQTRGYEALCVALKHALCEISGYDAVSLQPNSGAQGEYAGLLAIRAYHRSRGERRRTVCLIPSSAHGTNPASAAMAGMEVIIVKCDAHGNVDLGDLRTKCDQHANQLAALMVTYPSTHGVFEEGIREVCDIVHRAGGQVYVDGANLNAQVGLTRPGDYGSDVSHFNLHKTFCIPHGGGGPGMGPIGVKAHLAPFLPADGADASLQGCPVSAAPYGSASILPISYMYILLMGAHGLRRATEIAIVSANYIATRLDPHFPVLYKNARGRVAHECILDPRSYKDGCGVTVDDIAKRLIDFGFHAPTMSFPVAGTLMIEPTESEAKVELDRFCDAMITIREEIKALECGKYSVSDSPLRHAPHTLKDLLSETWNRPYSRATGCIPGDVPLANKYWAPVARIDNVYGDRNLMCTCPPLEQYAEAGSELGVIP